MVDQEKIRLLKKIADSEALPTLSPLAIQLIELAADDSSSAADLAAVIEKDPGLTARLLRMVGSAFFSRPETVTSISQAVVLVGFKKVRIMALSLSLRDAFLMDRAEGIDYQRFWKTSLYRALIAQDFVQCGPGGDLHPEEAFMAGLLAEIGMLLLFNECPEKKKQDFPGGGVPLEKAIPWEEKTFGVNHRELGRIVLQRWRFPKNLVESQKCFGANALDDHAPVLCKTIELARRATDIFFGETAELHSLQELAQKSLGLDSGAVNGILARAFGKVEELAQQLLVEVDSQKDILAVMEKANQALARINSSMETTLSGLLDNVSQMDQSRDRSSEERADRRQDILQNTLDAVAHEIRNPLLAIGGFSRRLAREGEGKGQGSEYAKIIADESARLESVLQEVMEYCQDCRPDTAEEDLVEIVTHVLGQTDRLAKESKIRVVRDFPGEPVLVLAERDGVAQVLKQLLEDAVNRIGKPGKGLITVSVRAGHSGVSVDIADNGRPMANEIRDALMDGNLSAKTFGGGLRLALAGKIVEAHNGSISLSMEDGEENRVTLSLPPVA